MPKDVRCPNPGCSHVFPAAAVAGVAALVCPECGGVFQVKPKSPGPPPLPGAAPAGRRKSRTASAAWLAAGLIVFVSLGLATVAVYRQARPPASAGGPEPYRSGEHNYSFLLPGPPWHRDADLAKRLGGVLAFRRDEPASVVVLAVRAFPTYVPTPGELREEAIARLRKFPFQNLQPEDKSGATLAGKPAGRFVFQGTVDGVIQSGDVQYLTHQGVGYWLFRWCPAEAVDQAAAGLADLADRFALLDLHPDWQPPRRTFTGTKASYTLTAEGDRWDATPYPPASYDPAADLALVAKERAAAADPTRQALLLVVLLPAGQGDPAERAKAHLLERQKEVYEATTLTDVPASDAAAPADKVGSEPGKVLTLRVKNTPDRERFVVLGVVARPDGPLMLWAECDFARRSIWEADFRTLIASYRPGK
ncbi:MAG TPA: hypothetical protein VGF55_20005 [Gemmataceae bacterium]|jgi:hypothetical protein